MTQPTLIQRARTGDPDAIAQLLERQLHPKGIRSEVHPQPDGLMILLAGEAQAPPQNRSVAYLRNAFQKLQANGVHRLHIHGTHRTASTPVWVDTVTLATESVAAIAAAPSRHSPSRQASAATAPTAAAAAPPTAQTQTKPAAKRFNRGEFGFCWLVLNVFLVGCFHFMPRMLYPLSLEPGSGPYRIWTTYQWLWMIPVALLQWVLLRPYLRRAYGWAIALIVIFYLESFPRGLVTHKIISLVNAPILTSTPLTSLPSQFPDAVRGLTFGALVGIAQWVILRQSCQADVRTAHWIWISAIAWMLGLGLPIIVALGLPNLKSVLPFALWPLVNVINFVAEGLGPLLFGIITCGVLVRWIPKMRTTEVP